jgi:predicted ATP-grasp superfamily ATP-dependent carboligase
VTGGGLAGAPLPTALCRDGDIMLRALVDDLAEVPGVEVVTTRDARLPDPGLRARVRRIAASVPCFSAGPPSRRDHTPAWLPFCDSVDAVWPIAPETGGVLAHHTVAVLASGRRLLASRPDAIEIAASKRRTSECLARAGVNVVPTVPLAEFVCGALPRSADGWVVKPDDGAGCEDTSWLQDANAVRDMARNIDDAGRYVVQPCLSGTPASLSLLCRDGAATLLTCNAQQVPRERGVFRFHGVVVGALEPERERYAPVVAAVAAALPGLWGYAGVDLVDTPRGPVVLEVNPRLTTSYAGLRTALGCNPASLVLALLDDARNLPTPPRAVRTCEVVAGSHHAA